jgi:hypothetical protein
MPRVLALLVLVVVGVAFPASAVAQTSSTGGAQFSDSDPAPIVAPGSKATLLPDGTAAAPADAPPQVQQAIWAANLIQDKPYVYGGGHGEFEDDGYDCSGTVSYALHGAGLLDQALDSGSFMKWGERGPGLWITVYTNPGHAYAVIAGLRLDTSAASVTRSNTRKFKKALERGPRWRPTMRSSRGFRARHPLGF